MSSRELSGFSRRYIGTNVAVKTATYSDGTATHTDRAKTRFESALRAACKAVSLYQISVGPSRTYDLHADEGPNSVLARNHLLTIMTSSM